MLRHTESVQRVQVSVRSSVIGYIPDAMVRSVEQVYAVEAVRLADNGDERRWSSVQRWADERVPDDHYTGAGVSDCVYGREEGIEQQRRSDKVGFD